MHLSQPLCVTHTQILGTARQHEELGLAGMPASTAMCTAYSETFQSDRRLLHWMLRTCCVPNVKYTRQHVSSEQLALAPALPVFITPPALSSCLAQNTSLQQCPEIRFPKAQLHKHTWHVFNIWSYSGSLDPKLSSMMPKTCRASVPHQPDCQLHDESPLAAVAHQFLQLLAAAATSEKMDGTAGVYGRSCSHAICMSEQGSVTQHAVDGC